jgi:hypothetical protein
MFTVASQLGYAFSVFADLGAVLLPRRNSAATGRVRTFL